MPHKRDSCLLSPRSNSCILPPRSDPCVPPARSDSSVIPSSSNSCVPSSGSKSRASSSRSKSSISSQGTTSNESRGMLPAGRQSVVFSSYMWSAPALRSAVITRDVPAITSGGQILNPEPSVILVTYSRHRQQRQWWIQRSSGNNPTRVQRPPCGCPLFLLLIFFFLPLSHSCSQVSTVNMILLWKSINFF